MEVRNIKAYARLNKTEDEQLEALVDYLDRTRSDTIRWLLRKAYKEFILKEHVPGRDELRKKIYFLPEDSTD